MPKQTGMQRPEDYNEQSVESEVTVGQSINELDPATGEPDWKLIARDAYETSTWYFDANIRKQVEKNISLFRSKHPEGSKYYQDSYRHRSKVFRPKVRAMTRRHEAAAALAFFATQDAVSTSPEDPNDEAAVYGARYGKNWLEYRLENSIPWFKTVIGAYQDAMTQGVVISRQEWLYEEKKTTVEVPDYQGGLVLLNEDSSVKMRKEEKVEVTVDKPSITIVPLENFRFAIGADWIDPIGDSPFLIEMMPMFVCHVKERMKAADAKTGEAKWFYLDDAQILSYTNNDQAYDSTRRVREGKREDSKEQQHLLQMFDIVWVHRNIIEIEGVDHIYYTLGTEFLLSEPVPLTDVFLHGRPYTMGSAVIETHRNYQSGIPELAQDLSVEANDLSNQVLDNIKLINNKRYRGRRGTNVDWRALTTSVPGGVILMDDLKDVEEEKFTDLTQSAFQTQDRNNADFDEIVGNFSNSSVQTNRSLNETVGGMAMQADDSNVITEYQLRVFSESWAEDTLRMLLDMGRHYETDERVLRLVGEGADPEVVAGLMDTNYNMRLAIGFGATSPHKRIEKISIGLKTIGEFMPDMLQKIKKEEVVREVFGALGFRDGAKFFDESTSENPELDQANEKIGQLEQMIESKGAEAKAKGEIQLQITQIREEGQNQRKKLELDHKTAAGEIQTQLDYIGHQLTAEQTDIKRGELVLEQEALQFQKAEMLRGMKEQQLQNLTEESNNLSTVLMNNRYGMVPNAEDADDGKKKDE